MDHDDELSELLAALPAEVSAGQRALEALAACEAMGIAPPAWVISDIVDCFLRFKQQRPAAGWAEESQDLVLSLGQAFGIEPMTRPSAKQARQRSVMTPRIEGAREVLKLQGKPATAESIAAALGLSLDDVRELQASRRRYARKARKPAAGTWGMRGGRSYKL